MDKLDQACSEITKLCSKYDYSEDLPANGYRSFLAIVQKYRLKVADSNDLWDKSEKEKIVCLLERTADLLLKLPERSDFSSSIDTDKAIMSASLNASRPPANPFSGPIDPFWIEGQAYTFFKRALELQAKFMSQTDEQSRGSIKSDNVHDMGMVSADRTSKWVIENKLNGPAVTMFETRSPGSAIDCLVMRPKENRHPQSVLFWIHGGGFISLSPFNYAASVAHFCDKVGVVTILPSYRKAPADRFPAGLQDVLDAYCFFTSGSHEVKDLIGFNPEACVISGDSAGGNLCTSLLFTLDMIRKAGGVVQLPIGIHLSYACHTPSPIIYPSTLLQIVDPHITPALMAMMMAFYPDSTADVNGMTWHQDPNCEQVMHLMQCYSENPLFNNLARKDWSSLKEIPLVVHAAEFDPLLDSAIQFAKQWQGNKAVRVAWGHLHGFFFLADGGCHEEVSIACKDITDLFLCNKVWQSSAEAVTAVGTIYSNVATVAIQ